MKAIPRDSVYLLDFFPATKVGIACQLSNAPGEYKAVISRYSHPEHFTQCDAPLPADEPTPTPTFTQCDAGPG